MDDHLGYGSGNTRNGYGTKKLKSGHGVIEIEIPRDRNGTFEPQFVAKNQTRLSYFDDKILTLYAKGMSTRDIVETFRDWMGSILSSIRAALLLKSDRINESLTRRFIWP